MPNVERAGCGVDPGISGHGSRFDERFQSSVCSEVSYILEIFIVRRIEALPWTSGVVLLLLTYPVTVSTNSLSRSCWSSGFAFTEPFNPVAGTEWSFLREAGEKTVRITRNRRSSEAVAMIDGGGIADTTLGS